MANLSLRRYDTQARVSVYVSIAACVSLLGMAYLVFRHLGIFLSDFTIPFSPTRRMLILAAAASTLLLSTIGFVLGYNSAGQRRNDKPTLSWIGFFISAATFCITLVLLVLVMQRGEVIR